MAPLSSLLMSQITTSVGAYQDFTENTFRNSLVAVADPAFANGDLGAEPALLSGPRAKPKVKDLNDTSAMYHLNP